MSNASLKSGPDADETNKSFEEIAHQNSDLNRNMEAISKSEDPNSFENIASHNKEWSQKADTVARKEDETSKTRKAFDAAKKATGYGKEALSELIENTGMSEPGLEALLKETGMDEKDAKLAAKAMLHNKKKNESLFHKDDENPSLAKKALKVRKRVKQVRRLVDYRYIFGLAILGLLILLLVLVGSLKLPDVMEGVESYEFAAVSNDFYEDATNYGDEMLSVDATDDGPDGVFANLKAQFGDLKDGIWTKILGTSPNDVLKNMTADNGFQMRFRTSKLSGRKIFTGGSLNNVDYEVDAPTGIGRWTPGIRSYLKFKSQQQFYDTGFLDDFMDQMKADQVAPLIRYIDFLKVLYASGGSLTGWILNKFIGNDDNKNAVTATQGQYAATETDDNDPDNSTMAQTGEAAAAAKAAEAADAGNPAMVTRDIANNGWLPNVLAAANAKLSVDLIQTVLHFTGIVWAVFAPLCIIYDGSVVQSGPSIANQMNQVQDSFDQLAAEADQQKQGDATEDDDGELANAVNGTNTEIGDISTSVPYQRAYGRVQSTNFIPSVEAGSDGSFQYSLLDVLGIPADSLEGKTANGIATNICHLMTNIWTSVGLTIAQIIAALLTFGGSEVAADAAGDTTAQFIKDFITESFENIFGKRVIDTVTGDVINEGFMARAVRFAVVQGTILGTTLGLTFLAHLEVAARAGVAHDGLAQGRNLIDDADDGANIQAGLLDRTQLFGRPLTAAEVSQIEGISMDQVDYLNSQKSFTQRYFSLNNYDSLATIVGMDLGASDHFSILSSISSLGSGVLRPFGSLATLIGSFASPTAFAANDPADYDYGNVQFGWSVAEKALINSSVSYKPLENQKILDDASNVNGMSRADAIAQKYAVCFGYQYNAGGNDDLDPNDAAGNMALDPNDTVSYLVASDPPLLVRDNNGDVINGGALCDPDNLSYDSGDALAADPRTPELNGVRSPQANDMIMRWRLALAYDTTADQLISEGTINATGE